MTGGPAKGPAGASLVSCRRHVLISNVTPDLPAYPVSVASPLNRFETQRKVVKGNG